MRNPSDVIILEGDTGIARMFCGHCGGSFRGYLNAVTTANKQPICLGCILEAQPQRVARGLRPIPVNTDAYLED